MNESITLEELSRETDSSREQLEAWAELGLLPGDPSGFPGSHIERVRLIQFASSRGISPEELAESTKTQGDLLGVFVDSLGHSRTGPTLSVDEAAERLGADRELLERIRAASGATDLTRLEEVDLEAAGWALAAIGAGMPEDAVIQLMRVFADASGRITDAASRLFHLYVHEALRAQGKSGPELLADTHAISEPLRGILEPAVIYFHRKAWERAVREDLLLHLAEAVSEAPVVPGQLVRAILFTDLSGFTPLTEAMGDTAASRVVDRFSELVRDAAARNHGQILKQIGDEFMVVFAAARSAVECALDVERAATAEPNFPAVRSGVHVGPVLYREADYVGANVNLAARVAGQAQGHQLLVTDAVREEVGGIPDVTITFLGRRELKGMPAPVDLYSVEFAEPQPQRIADPVCGMELDPDRAAAEVTWAGRRYWFCSPRCLQRFAEAPEQYAAH